MCITVVSKEYLNLMKQNRFYTMIIIMVLLVSCAYQYLNYAADIKEKDMELINIHNEYKQIRWNTIQSIIDTINTGGNMRAKLASNVLMDNIMAEYDECESCIKQDILTSSHNTPKLNTAIIKTISKDGFFGHLSNRDGLFIATDNKVLYSIITPQEYFFSTWEEFINSNYNKDLATKTYTILKIPITSGIKLLEPYAPIVNTQKEHKIINSSSLTELKNVFYEEGLAGLSGYLLLSSYYIYGNDSGLELSEVTTDGTHISNKIVVISYVSIYDILIKDYASTISAIDAMEERAVNNDKIDRNKIYYSSIKSLLFHIICIVFVLIITRNRALSLIKADEKSDQDKLSN